MARTLTIAFTMVLLTTVAHAQTTVIKAGHLFDARTGRMLEGQTVVIEGNRIKAIGPNVTYRSDARVIDLSHSWVLPGLMGCHVHITTNLTYRERNWNEKYETESNGLRALRGSVARQLLDNGFTTIKDIGQRRQLRNG